MKNNKNIFLIGGGEIANGETKDIDKIIVQSAARDSSFVFFGAAAGDAEGYGDAIIEIFGDYFNVTIATEAKGLAHAEEAINNASVIYLGGGNTELLMNLFKKWDLVKLLQKAAVRGAIIVGMSAGAQALSSWFIHEEDGRQEIRKGWGVISDNISILVHATKISFDDAKKISLDAEQKSNYQIYGIEERAAIKLDVDASDLEFIGKGRVWS
jgi:cyanophycinase-like exopeptidase